MSRQSLADKFLTQVNNRENSDDEAEKPAAAEDLSARNIQNNSSVKASISHFQTQIDGIYQASAEQKLLAPKGQKTMTPIAKNTVMSTDLGGTSHKNEQDDDSLRLANCMRSEKQDDNALFGNSSAQQIEIAELAPQDTDEVVFDLIEDGMQEEIQLRADSDQASCETPEAKQQDSG